MNARTLALLALALLAGSAGFVVQHWRSPPAPAPAATPDTNTVASQPAEPLAWSFARPDGTVQSLEAWRGQVVVLNFWATWCPPCLREIPAFVALQAELGAVGVQFVGIALDQADPVQAFAADKGVNYPVLIGDQDVARFMVSLGNEIGALPYTAVLDRTGAVVYTHQGEWAPAAARATLEDLLDTP